jgi:CDP-diacylglycerol--serine O-phosphatidyltransferase
MKIEKNIPNVITLMNLLSGTLAILFILRDELVLGSVCITVALVLDFLDGFLARLLHAQSPIGEQLDSLSDLVSFGVAPGYILWSLMKSTYLQEGISISGLLPYFAFLVPVFSAIRLANFTIDSSQKYTFRGLPTPASAIFIGAIPLLLVGKNTPALLQHIFSSPTALLIIAIVISFLMVAPVSLLSLKFKDFSWKSNWLRYLLLLAAILLVILLGFAAFPIIILCYILLSVLFLPQRRESLHADQ